MTEYKPNMSKLWIISDMLESKLVLVSLDLSLFSPLYIWSPQFVSSYHYLMWMSHILALLCFCILSLPPVGTLCPLPVFPYSPASFYPQILLYVYLCLFTCQFHINSICVPLSVYQSHFMITVSPSVSICRSYFSNNSPTEPKLQKPKSYASGGQTNHPCR